MRNETLDATVTAAAPKLTGAGAFVTVLGGVTASDIGVWLGMLIGVTGLMITWYYKRKSDRRSQEAHEAYMAKLQASHTPPSVFDRHEAGE